MGSRPSRPADVWYVYAAQLPPPRAGLGVDEAELEARALAADWFGAQVSVPYRHLVARSMPALLDEGEASEPHKAEDAHDSSTKGKKKTTEKERRKAKNTDKEQEEAEATRDAKKTKKKTKEKEEAKPRQHAKKRKRRNSDI